MSAPKTVAEIEQLLRDNVASIARQCLPGGREEGGYFCAGDISGGKGGSLVVYLKGAKQGLWRDYAADVGGDMLDLIEQTQGLAGKGAAVVLAKEWLGIDDGWAGRATQISPEERAARARRLAQMQERRQAETNAANAKAIKDARGLYLNRATRPIAGTPAEAYLLGRNRVAVGGAWPGGLKFDSVWQKDTRQKEPAMLAPVYLPSGDLVACHRTYLQPCPDRGWTKLAVPKAKLVLGRPWGGFIPISKGASGKSMGKMTADEAVYMAEGIEKCLAIREIRPEFRIVAGVSLGNMGAIVFPPHVRRLVIVADRDDNDDAVRALERAVAAQQSRIGDVRLVFPPQPYKDIDEWVDAARAQARRAGAA
ncbi:toprim domain-containing protein [Novosphingobium capsulatum]|uniref:DUF7146 domain-containing protein n=1 Tax=Novosphingobium capsulatum TaxID=13688 RepID=UPI002E0D1E9E|nr:toprim domain-containing protein [Novosphingobium capsulatum]